MTVLLRLRYRVRHALEPVSDFGPLNLRTVTSPVHWVECKPLAPATAPVNHKACAPMDAWLVLGVG